MQRFVILGAPEGKARPRFTRTGHAFTPQRTRDYEECVRTAWAQSGCAMLDGPIAVRIYAYHTCNKSDSRPTVLRKLTGKLLPTKKPDWDNIGKIICDALNGIAYADDAQVTDGRVVKRYSAEPRVVVELEPDPGKIG